MGFLGPLLGLFGGLAGGGGRSSPQQQIDPDLQNLEKAELARYNFTDPFFQSSMGAVANKANTSPFYAGTWMNQAQKLRRPALMMLSKGQQSKNPTGADYNPMALQF